jgi:N6-adenosine-specific RNA methylase IME4
MSDAIVKYDAACRGLSLALANAKTVSDARKVGYSAEALRAYAKQAKNKGLEVDAAEIRIRAERRVGELIAQQKSSVGLHPPGRPSKIDPAKGSISPSLSEALGLPRGDALKLSARAQQLAAVPGRKFEAMLTEWRDRVQRETERVTVNLLREGRRRQGGGPPLLAGAYRLLYVDPPWQYEHIVTESRAIENQYPTMELDAIKALEVPAAEDAVLFLWATSPKLAEAIDVIRAWDFDYRTSAVWDKEVIGMGYYFRQQHELLLVAARGALPVPAPSDRVSSVIRARRQAHSQKPEIVYDVLEAMYPTFGELDRVELFQRAPRAGWAGWGNESAVAS